MQQERPYDISLSGQAQLYNERLADDGTQAQIDRFQRRLRKIADNPYSGTPYITEWNPHQNALFQQLRGCVISDAYYYEGADPEEIDPQIAGHPATQPSLLLDFTNGWSLELAGAELPEEPTETDNKSIPVGRVLTLGDAKYQEDHLTIIICGGSKTQEFTGQAWIIETTPDQN